MDVNRDLNLFIEPDGESYRLTAYPIEGRVIRYALPLDKFQLHTFINEVNRTLEKISARKEYSRSIEVPRHICDEDLREIAELKILDNIFLGQNPSVNAQQVVKKIKKLSSEQPLNIQIITERFSIPWTLIYDGELKYGERSIDRNAFWGFKHVLDNPPDVEGQWSFDSIIGTQKLLCSLNVNETIDSVYGLHCVRDQIDFFEKIEHPSVDKLVRNTEDEVLRDFADEGGVDDSIVYFFCHAHSTSDFNAGTKDIYIKLKDEENKLTLHNLKAWAGSRNFVNEPLVFINACESVSLNPIFYDGFVPYFIAKGARGVLGTISKIPAIFASKFAQSFFERFLERQRIGEILPKLRNEYLENYNNLLGLYYMSYCHSRLCLDSPIIFATRAEPKLARSEKIRMF